MIYLVRHGETAFNVARRAQGAKDSPLTELGVRQARAVAARLAELVAEEPGPWAMVSSPLGRTRATAEIISQRLGLAYRVDARIREHSLGDWDGLLADEFLPLMRADMPAHERQFHAPGGESYQTITSRIGDFLAERREDERLIVVSHGAAGRVLRGIYLGLAPEAMMTQPVPQDAIFRLHAGEITRVDCGPVRAED